MSVSMTEENHEKNNKQSNSLPDGERIAKKMARAGLCSRRDAEKWIEEGRVRVNGKILTTAACVVTDNDKILVNGKPLDEKPPARLFLYHKPSGLVTSHKDEKGRDTIFDRLPEALPRVISVGRLDLNTEGLLLLTNDGGLSRYLELPATGWKRKYRVRVHGRIDKNKLDGLQKGITIGGVEYKSIEAEIDETAAEKSSASGKGGTNTWLNITLREGKNREIRKVMEALGLQVTRLIRVSYGPFQLGNLAVGGVMEVKTQVMKDQVKGYFQGKPLTENAQTKAKREGARPASGKTTPAKKEAPKDAAARKPSGKKPQPRKAMPSSGPAPKARTGKKPFKKRP